MEKINEFQKRFKNYDNRKLLKIIEEADNYQPTAVETAKLELSKRAINENEIQILKDEILNEKSKINSSQEQSKKFENKIRSLAIEILHKVSPIQITPKQIDSRINYILVSLAIFVIARIYSQLNTSYITFNHAALDILLTIILSIAIFYFWKREKIGWMLLNLFYVYSILDEIIALFHNFKLRNAVIDDDYSLQNGIVTLQDGPNLFTPTSPITYVVIIAVFAILLWANFKEDLRKLYEIDVKTGLVTIGASILITFILKSQL